MRAIIKLIAVGAVVGVFALDDGWEFALGGSALLVIVAYAIHRMDRLPAIDPRITHRVLPIADVQATGDIEGKTVRAPRPAEVAYQMHQRYAPSFDQQLAVSRHIDRYGDERYQPASRADLPVMTYEQARERAAGFDDEPPTETDEYARLFDEQLALHRKTRLARGSYTPTQYAAVEEPSQGTSQRPSQEGPAMVRPTARRV